MNTKDILPLRKQPAYQAAAEKVGEIARALTENETRIQECEAALQQAFGEQEAPAASINKALAIARGESHKIESYRQELDRLRAERGLLRAGYVELCAARDRIDAELSQEAGRQARAAHVEKVKALQRAVIQLGEANEAEEMVRRQLEALGYDRHGLPPMGLDAVGSADDQTGSRAYYYMRESSQYIDRK